MAVNVQCPGCFSAVPVPQEKLGQRVKCRACGEVFVAQGKSSQGAGTKGGDAKVGNSRKGPGSKKSKKGAASSSPVGLIAGAAAAALVLGIAVYMFLGRGDNDAAPLAPVVAVIPAAPPATPPPAPVVTPPAPSALPVVVTPPDFPEQAFLTDNLVGLVVAHPRRILTSPLGQLLRENPAMQSFEQEFRALEIPPESVERVTLVVNQSLVNQSAKAAGIETAAPEGPSTGELTDNLKRIAMAMELNHDAYKSFPWAEGSPGGHRRGLSWRVWMLPYLDQGRLYGEFNFDEPWDSPTNKALIPRMPAIYKTPGVADPTKTSMQVFVGPGTMFEGDKGINRKQITDGTSNTLVAVIAGPDTAEVWTKPGGLPYDPKNPKKALGNIGDGPLLITLADGSVRQIPADISDTTLTYLIERADGHPVEIPGAAAKGTVPQTPTLIMTFSTPPKRDALLARYPATLQHESETIYTGDRGALWFADPQTVLIGPLEPLKGMVTTRKSGGGAAPKVVPALTPGADLTFSFDLQPQAALLEKAAGINPVLAQLLQVQTIALEASVTAPSGGTLLQVVASTADDKAGETLIKGVNGLLDGVRSQLADLPAPDAADPKKGGFDLIKTIVGSITTKQEGTQIVLHIPVPAEFEKVPDLLKPLLMRSP